MVRLSFCMCAWIVVLLLCVASVEVKKHRGIHHHRKRSKLHYPVKESTPAHRKRSDFAKLEVTTMSRKRSKPFEPDLPLKRSKEHAHAHIRRRRSSGPESTAKTERLRRDSGFQRTNTTNETLIARVTEVSGNASGNYFEKNSSPPRRNATVLKNVQTLQNESENLYLNSSTKENGSLDRTSNNSTARIIRSSMYGRLENEKITASARNDTTVESHSQNRSLEKIETKLSQRNSTLDETGATLIGESAGTPQDTRRFVSTGGQQLISSQDNNSCSNVNCTTPHAYVNVTATLVEATTGTVRGDVKTSTRFSGDSTKSHLETTTVVSTYEKKDSDDTSVMSANVGVPPEIYSKNSIAKASNRKDECSATGICRSIDSTSGISDVSFTSVKREQPIQRNGCVVNATDNSEIYHNATVASLSEADATLSTLKVDSINGYQTSPASNFTTVDLFERNIISPNETVAISIGTSTYDYESPLDALNKLFVLNDVKRNVDSNISIESSNFPLSSNSTSTMKKLQFLNTTVNTGVESTSTNRVESSQFDDLHDIEPAENIPWNTFQTRAEHFPPNLENKLLPLGLAADSEVSDLSEPLEEIPRVRRKRFVPVEEESNISERNPGSAELKDSEVDLNEKFYPESRTDSRHKRSKRYDTASSSQNNSGNPFLGNNAVNANAVDSSNVHKSGMTLMDFEGPLIFKDVDNIIDESPADSVHVRVKRDRARSEPNLNSASESFISNYSDESETNSNQMYSTYLQDLSNSFAQIHGLHGPRLFLELKNETPIESSHWNPSSYSGSNVTHVKSIQVTQDLPNFIATNESGNSVGEIEFGFEISPDENNNTRVVDDPEKSNPTALLTRKKRDGNNIKPLDEEDYDYLNRGVSNLVNELNVDGKLMKKYFPNDLDSNAVNQLNDVYPDVVDDPLHPVPIVELIRKKRLNYGKVFPESFLMPEETKLLNGTPDEDDGDYAYRTRNQNNDFSPNSYEKNQVYLESYPEDDRVIDSMLSKVEYDDPDGSHPAYGREAPYQRFSDRSDSEDGNAPYFPNDSGDISYRNENNNIDDAKRIFRRDISHVDQKSEIGDLSGNLLSDTEKMVTSNKRDSESSAPLKDSNQRPSNLSDDSSSKSGKKKRSSKYRSKNVKVTRKKKKVPIEKRKLKSHKEKRKSAKHPNKNAKIKRSLEVTKEAIKSSNNSKTSADNKNVPGANDSAHISNKSELNCTTQASTESENVTKTKVSKEVESARIDEDREGVEVNGDKTTNKGDSDIHVKITENKITSKENEPIIVSKPAELNSQSQVYPNNDDISKIKDSINPKTSGKKENEPSIVSKPAELKSQDQGSSNGVGIAITRDLVNPETSGMKEKESIDNIEQNKIMSKGNEPLIFSKPAELNTQSQASSNGVGIAITRDSFDPKIFGIKENVPHIVGKPTELKSQDQAPPNDDDSARSKDSDNSNTSGMKENESAHIIETKNPKRDDIQAVIEESKFISMGIDPSLVGKPTVYNSQSQASPNDKDSLVTINSNRDAPAIVESESSIKSENKIPTREITRSNVEESISNLNDNGSPIVNHQPDFISVIRVSSIGEDLMGPKVSQVDKSVITNERSSNDDGTEMDELETRDKSAVVDEFQIESRIEKRDSTDSRSEVEVDKRDISLKDQMQIASDDLDVSQFDRNEIGTLNDVGNISPHDGRGRRDTDGYGNLLSDDYSLSEDNLKTVDGLSDESDGSRVVDGLQSIGNTNGVENQERITPDQHVKQIVGNSDMKESSGNENLNPSGDKMDGMLLNDGRVPSFNVDDKFLSRVNEIEALASESIQSGGDENLQEISHERRGIPSKHSRVKRHDDDNSNDVGAVLQQHYQGNSDQEVKYYDDVHEPVSPQHEIVERRPNNPADKLRGERAVKSVEEIKELMEKLVAKVDELQNYMGNDNTSKKSKKRSEIDNPHSNITSKEAGNTSDGQSLSKDAKKGSCTIEKIQAKADIKKDNKQKECSSKEKRLENSASQKRSIRTLRGRKSHKRGRRKRKSHRKWDRWTDWSSCSVTCGKGRQIRWRHCIHECTTAETEMEEKACQLPACGPGKFLGIF